MAVSDELIGEMENVISASAGIGYSNSSAANDVYEGYIWALCLQAAKLQNGIVSFETSSGQSAYSLIFRTSPGNIFSQSQQYTHANLSFGGCPPLEVHIGIKVLGKSRVLHECDVAIVEKAEAELCRRESVHPRASKVFMAIECKFYTSNLQLHLGRGFLGLTNEIHRDERYIISNARSSNVAKLINHHKAEWEFGVFPQMQEAQALLQRFARAFRNYRTGF